MPGTNAGTGQPITLRCAKCKNMVANEGRGYQLVATGATQGQNLHRGIRQTTRKIQYRCRECGHLGWTQHIDAERLLAQLDYIGDRNTRLERPTQPLFDPCVCGHEKADHANWGTRGWCNGGCGNCDCLEFRRSRAKHD